MTEDLKSRAADDGGDSDAGRAGHGPDGSDAGLTTAEAARRLATFGPNATADVTVDPLRLLLGKFIAPVPCLLEAAIALQLFLGEYAEAAVIALLLVFNAALGFFHEGRAQATLSALKSRLALNASVRRDGAWTTIPVGDIVPGDRVKLSLGCIVPADVRILSGGVLLDQSTITGESLPVEGVAETETYAGVLVRRGEAEAVVLTTGARTRFGRAAELVRTASVVSTQQKAIFAVVRNLALVNGIVASLLIAYAWHIGMPAQEFVRLALISVLATVPVALPATFTLASAIGAQALARQGVLPTRLSAIDEAASMNVLCSDKTGTLTQNELAVATVRALPGWSEDEVLSLAALASSDGGQDPVDRAVTTAAARVAKRPRRLSFTPFDPTVKRSEATFSDGDGTPRTAMKGAFATIAALCSPPTGEDAADALANDGYRVLGVAVGTRNDMRLAGLVALSDPPRPDAAPCIAALRRLGVDVVIVTGDAVATARVVARAVGVDRPVHPPGAIEDSVRPNQFGVFAGVLPEDKFRLVKAFQREGYTVGMCGDGANDAPALRQAQIGIAVSTATDVARSAAGVVLTEPGLAGILAAVREGRITFQRILTYTLRSIVNKVRQVLFLAIGLVMTRHAILTPMMVVLSLIGGDFFALSATTDNVEPSPQPNSWRIDSLMLAGIALGVIDLLFCVAVLAFGAFRLHLDLETLQTLTLVTLAFNGQAVFYAVRERRRLWSSRPSNAVLLSTVAELLYIPGLAAFGILIPRLPIKLMLPVLFSSLLLAFMLDAAKAAIFRHLRMI